MGKREFPGPILGGPWPSGVVLWEGESSLPGRYPIVAIAGTIPSTNRKTGPMLPTWILHRTIDPVRAIEYGADEAVCGSCPYRAGACYVVPGQAPLSVFRAYERGSYPRLSADSQQRAREVSRLFSGSAVRLGSYGDPAAVPFGVWEQVCRAAVAWTGYTHAWRECDQELRSLCMASVDSERERDEARAAGWRSIPCSSSWRADSSRRVFLPGERGGKPSSDVS